MGDRLIRALLRERFVVTLRSGETFDGLLLSVDEKTLRLGNVFAVTEKARVGVDGELFVPRPEILYLQKPAVMS